MDRIRENAIQWARSYVDKADYAGWCLSFIEDAVEQSNRIDDYPALRRLPPRQV